MSQPEEHPCPCEACDEYALGPATYCVTCEHHNCSSSEPNCPAMENSPKWCDTCGSKTDTEHIHGSYLCSDCQQFEDACKRDYKDLECEWCTEDLSFPLVLDDGTVIENPDELSYGEVMNIDSVYHIECKEERGTQKRREEQNMSIDEF